MTAAAQAPTGTDLEALFRPRGVAVVGASRSPGKLGQVMAASLSGWGGPVGLVNARSPEPADGVHGSVAAAVAAQGPMDLAVLCVPAAVCAEAVREAAGAGTRAALVCAGGFAEAGAEGAAHQAALVAAATATGVRLLGPNTSGFLSPGQGLFATFVPAARQVRPGGVAVVAASGGVNHALAFLLADAGIGVSLAVGLGNAVDVSAADVLAFLADDPATRAVVVHIESVADGRRLLDSVSRVAACKPVIALVVGRADVGAFAQSHTGALATSWRTTRALLRQAGAVLVGDERELVDAAAALSTTRLAPSPNPGVGVVTAQAGPGLLVLDELRSSGVEVPELTRSTQQRLADLLPPLTFQANPVDTGRPGPGFAEVLAAVAEDEGVDLLAGYALAEPGALDLPTAVARLRARSEVPVVFALGGLRHDTAADHARLAAAGVPTLSGPTALANAARALTADARAAYRLAARAENEGRPAPATPAGPFDAPLDEDAAKGVLGALGIATPRRVACASPEQAREALATLSAPVAVKLLDAAVLHKTEVGGVLLGIRTAQELDAAVARLQAAGASRFLVEEMAPPGVDLLVGARRDPVFGPVVVLAAGGTAAEAMADVAIRSLPLTADEAASMPDDLVSRPLLEGWRGGPVLQRAELAAVLLALGDLVLHHPTIDEVDVNPLRLTAGGLIALDAVITTKEQ